MLEFPDLNTESTIFVRLLDEGVDVWRPAKAFYLGDMQFKIAPAEIDREIETWEFWPGDVVKVEMQQKLSELLPIAVAKRSVER